MSTATATPPAKTLNAPKATKPAAPKPTAPAAPAPQKRVLPKFGDFKARITSLDVLLSSERPVIFTRLKLEDSTEHTHAVRLNHPQAMQIGLDEFRAAFPDTLGALDNVKLISYLMQHTTKVIGLSCEVSVDRQMKNGLPVLGPDGQPYYNVRLRSALRDIKAETADALAARLVEQAGKAQVPGSAVNDAAFADKE